MEKLLKYFGIGQGPNRVKSKLTHFRDFVESIKNEEGPDFLDNLEMLDN